MSKVSLNNIQFLLLIRSLSPVVQRYAFLSLCKMRLRQFAICSVERTVPPVLNISDVHRCEKVSSHQRSSTSRLLPGWRGSSFRAMPYRGPTALSSS